MTSPAPTAPGPFPSPRGIGTLNEGSLHAALKRHYQRPGDEIEVRVGDYVADLRRGHQLIEIQTGSFGAMGNKLDRLLDTHPVLIVHPVAVRTRLVRPAGTRRSPRRGSIYSLFDELVSLPTLLDHPHLSIEVVLVNVDCIQRPDPRARRGRGGYRVVDHVLTEVLASERFDAGTDLLRLVPTDLPDPFTTAELATRAKIDRATAQKMAYCLAPLGLFTVTGRTRAGRQYRLAEAPRSGANDDGGTHRHQ